jgi:hypothetical protein
MGRITNGERLPVELSTGVGLVFVYFSRSLKDRERFKRCHPEIYKDNNVIIISNLKIHRLKGPINIFFRYSKICRI